MKKISIIIMACCCMQFVHAQEFSVEKIDAYLDTLEQNDRFMGSVCVSRADKNIYSKSVGFSNIETKTKANQQSTYKIGSISKTFTAVMIYQAIEQGRLTSTTTLNNYFPTIVNADKITIDHLLSHRSGIPNFIDNDFYKWATEKQSRLEMLKIIAAQGSDFTPDSKTQYSNSNYVLLSYILEIIYDKTYSKILQKNIISPLKLANTSFGNAKLSCSSYKYLDKWRIESDNTHESVTMGAGAIVSTSNDLNHFFYALFSGKLISQNSLMQMKNVTDGLGRGLIQIPFGRKIGYGHTGSIDGFNAVSVYFPDDKTAYSLTSNGSNYIINNISIAILSGIYNMNVEIPNFKVANLTAADLIKYLGVYSSPQLPLKITVTHRDKTLVAQGTGQSSFDLVASTENIFRFDQAGIVMIFDSEKGTMILKQGGASFLLKKE